MRLIPQRRHIINLTIILAVGAIAYCNSFHNEFLWDDRPLIVDNTNIKSFHNVTRVFEKGIFEESGGFNFYRPMHMLVNMLDYSIWKLEPFGYHLTNFILHFAAACLVYWILLYFLKEGLVALFLSLIFIAHPSATEVVTFISTRADALALVFILASFILFIKSRRPVSLLFFALACLSKEVAVMFPVFLFLFLLNRKKSVLSSWPYFAISLGAMALRYAAFKNTESLFINTACIPLYIRLINFPLIIAKYVFMFAAPGPFVFERTVTVYPSLLNMPVLLSVTAALPAVFFLVKFYRSRTALGAMWFLAFIFPVSGIIPINAFLYHHWLYIPSLGLLMILGDIIIRIYKKAPRYILFIAAAAILILLTLLTLKQNNYFKDEVTFYEETLKKTPQSARIHYNLGLVYIEKGLIQKGIDSFKKAIELRPGYAEAYVNLGYTYQKMGRNREAQLWFEKGAAAAPMSYLPYYYLANLYSDTGRLKESIEFYKKALGIKTDKPSIYYDMAVACDKAGDIKSAEAAYRKTLELDASYTNACINLGALLAQEGRPENAKEVWERGLKREPDNPDLKKNLERLKKILK